MDFGAKLKNLREARRKSQALVAREMSNQFPDFSISQTYLSTLENSSKAPRQEILEILAAYYDVSLSYFFGDDETTKSANIGGYIEALRRFTPDSDRRFAHRSELRDDENDEIQENLDDLDLLDSDY